MSIPPIDRSRRCRDARRLLLTALAVLGAGAGAGAVAGCQDAQPPATPCAVLGVTGSLPGVTLAIRSDACVYEMGRPARFTYEVATDATVPPIDLPASSGCGECSPPAADPGTWIQWSIDGTSSGGESQQYCECDVGCCPSNVARTVQPAAGTATGVIDWPGRNWSGPSDYNAPLGAAFPPGLYRVVVTFPGYARGSVTAELPIEIVSKR